jgi:hypothetical protein
MLYSPLKDDKLLLFPVLYDFAESILLLLFNYVVLASATPRLNGFHYSFFLLGKKKKANRECRATDKKLRGSPLTRQSVCLSCCERDKV